MANSRPRSAQGISHKGVLRDYNRSVILGAIKGSGQLSRADLAKSTGLSMPTVSAICQTLIDEELVRETHIGESTGGRKPVLMEVNPGGAFSFGVKLMERSFVLSMTDLRGDVVAKTQISLANTEPESVFQEIAQGVRQIISEQHVPRQRVLGMGVAISGIVDPQQGILSYSPLLQWRQVSIASALSRRLRVPVIVDNDVNAVALSEHWFGLGLGCRHFLTLSLGRGIGLGIVVNGQLYRGSRGGAGEFGHSVVDPQGPLCDCGNRGCLEAYASDPALLTAARQATGQPDLDPDEALRLAQEGDGRVLDVYRTAGEILGRSVASLVNTLNPERIVVMGEGVRAGELLLEPMRRSIKQHALEVLHEDLAIIVDPWDDWRWSKAAANMLLSQAFVEPIQLAEQTPGAAHLAPWRALHR